MSTQLKTLEEGWSEIGQRFEKLNVDAKYVFFARFAFFAGVSFMMEQVQGMGQPDVSDDTAVAWHRAMQDDLAKNVVEGMATLGMMKSN